MTRVDNENLVSLVFGVAKIKSAHNPVRRVMTDD